MENEVNLPYICLFWSWDWDYFSWNCSYNFEMCTFLSSKYVETCLLYSNFRYRVRPELELKSDRLGINLLPGEGEKVENFDFLRHFWLLIKKGYFFILGPQGGKSPSWLLCGIAKFLIKCLAIILSHFLIIWISFLLGLYKNIYSLVSVFVEFT